MATQPHTTSFDRAAILRAAWSSYNDQISAFGEGGFAFSRKLFTAHLRTAWRQAKAARLDAELEASKAARRASLCPTERRVQEINDELHAQLYDDRIDWNHRGALQSELNSLRRVAA